MTLVFVTALSIIVAAVMSVVAWRIAGEERRRSEARVDGLAADIYDYEGESFSPVEVGELFAADARADPRAPFVKAIAVGALAVGSLVAVLVLLTAGPRSSSAGAPAPAASRGPAAEVPQIELVALSHHSDGNRLTVRGIVRSDRRRDAALVLTAVVFAVNREGTVVGSGRAPVEIAGSGGASDVESTFAATIAGVGEIHRYRVSFRSGDRTIAHLDRREQLQPAQLP